MIQPELANFPVGQCNFVRRYSHAQMNRSLIASLLLCCFFIAQICAAEPEPDNEEAFRLSLVAAIHHFAEKGDLEHIKGIIDKFPQLVDARLPRDRRLKPSITDSYNALHYAAREGCGQIVSYLLDKGADVNSVSQGGWTALHEAARVGDLAVVKILVAHGAKVDAKSEAVPEWSGIPPSSSVGARPQKWPAIPARTPLDLANANHHKDVCEYFKKQMSRR